MSHRKKLIATVLVVAWSMMVVPGIFLATSDKAPTLAPAPVNLQRSVLLLEMFDESDQSLGHGSCFIVAHRNGWWYAVTAKHCIENTDPWTGGFTGDVPKLRIDSHNVELMRKSPDCDVALIRFKSEESFKVLTLAEPQVGETCTTVGWAGGTFLQLKGHVAGFNFKAGDEKYTAANTGLFPGCSGGVLLNAKNEVIGVTVAVAAYNGIWDTVGLFVPIQYVHKLMEAI